MVTRFRLTNLAGNLFLAPWQTKVYLKLYTKLIFLNCNKNLSQFSACANEKTSTRETSPLESISRLFKSFMTSRRFIMFPPDKKM